ncbi:SIR2-domain-containing protein, partial [Nadsonia fulvescens var. elongata DSM 6958]
VTPRDRLPHPSNMDEFITVLDKAQRVLVVTGAGISTSLNIPDFRSSRGIYKQIEHMGLSDPQEVFDMSLFSHDPRPFYTVAHRILYDSDVYSPTHGFIKMLEDRGKLLRNYTQNIEDLEYKAGISRDKIVQCHGSFAGATCTKCGYKVPGSSIFPDIRAQKVARCPECVESYKLTQNNVKKGKSNSSYNSSSDDDDSENEYAHIGVMKPDIVFFGEPLPHRFHDLIVQDVLDCDLLICMGTSLQVSPVCDIPRYTPANVPQVYVSLQPAKRFNFDITFLGKCDDVVEMFLNKLNWKMTHSMLKGKFPGNLETDETKRYV